MEVSYSNSSALSPAHYRLVQSLETATSSAATLSALISALTSIRQRWSKGPISSSTLHHDLLLALYCASQRPSNLAAAYQELLSLEWCLPNAVKLAGGGVEAKLDYRKTGYRACDEIFTTVPHPLKLLLINTIRSDLHVPPYHPQAPARWILALRAAASPRLASAELVPAVAERALELLQDPGPEFGVIVPHIRRLALAALLNLLLIPCSTTDALLPQVQRTALRLLAPPEPVASSSTSSSSTSTSPRRSRRSRPSPTSSSSTTPTDPSLLAALVAALTSPASPLHVEEGGRELVPCLLSLLARTTSGEWATRDKRWEYRGVVCGWLVGKILKGLEGAALGEREGKDEQEKVAKGVLKWVEASGVLSLLEKGGLGHGLVLSALSVLSTLPTSLLIALPPPLKMTLNDTLDALARALQRRREPNSVIFGLQGLRAVDPALWTSKGEEEGECELWGEKTWRGIMGGVEDADEGVRRATLRLLLRVDPSLVELHLTRLFAALEALSSASSSASTSTRQRDRLLSLLLEASSIVDASDGSTWAGRVLRMLRSAQARSDGAEQQLLPLVITSTIDRFSALPSVRQGGKVQAEFGRAVFESTGWREGSVNEGLIVAACCGMGEVAEGEGEREKVVRGIGGWLARGQAPAALVEPFSLALLRLLGLASTQSIPALAQDLTPLLGSNGDGEAFTLLRRALSPLDVGTRTLEVLRRAARRAEEGTLVGFWGEVQRSGEASAAEASPPPSPSPRKARGGGGGGEERPLRYSYSALPAAPTTKGKPTFDESAHERRARGGRGGVGESVMGAGALALLGLEDGKEESDDDDEEEEERTTPMQRSLGGGGAGAGSELEQPRRRSGSDNSATEEESPPDDLLIELAGMNVNPFHDGL